MTKKPEKPVYEMLRTPDMAVGSAIDKLTNPETIEFLANIDKREIARYSLLLSIADDFKLKWLKTFIISELKLTCSIEGKRAEQLVAITRQPEIFTQDTGLLSKIRSKLR